MGVSWRAGKSPRIKLVYPAQLFHSYECPRPDGSLGLAYLAGILRDHDFDVSILDACAGEDGDHWEDSFHNRTILDSGHVRVGLSADKIKEKLAGFDMVGVTSIFTPQTHSCFEIARLVKDVDPGITLIAGGGNARALYKQFLDNGFDLVVFGEGEETLLELATCFATGRGFEQIAGVAYKSAAGDYVVNPARPALMDLDRLPFPAWDLLPLKRYWKIGQPHSGDFEAGSEVRYLSMQTSRGCPFVCKYCHISKEGDAARLRLKSYDRVMAEIDVIKNLGAEYLFFEDDSLLAKRERIKKIFRGLNDKGLKLVDVNGVNLAHFFRRSSEGKLEVDTDLLDLMMEVGWVEIGFPFESGCQRILDKYASAKWRKSRHDVGTLVRESAKRGLKTMGFFTIGYPDESYEELSETLLFAKEMADAGLNSAGFYLMTPYPGSVLYDMAVAGGHLPEQLQFSDMRVGVPTMKNTAVPPEALEFSRRLVYQLINRPDFLEKRKEGELASQIEDGVDLARVSGREP